MGIGAWGKAGRTGLACVAALALGLAMVAGGAPRSASAQMTADGWEFALLPCPTGGGYGTGSFESGPGVPPNGSGSFVFSLASDGLAWLQLHQSGLDGVPLASLHSLAYTTFVVTGGTQAAPYLMLQVDLDDDGLPDDRLVYFPASNDTVTPIEWQTWDALDGVWWSLNGRAGMTQASPQPLSVYLAAYPNATLANADDTGALVVAAGCLGGVSWSSWQGAVDAVSVAYGATTITWDFESTGVVTSRRAIPGGPLTFTNLTPAPWSTVAPGEVTVAVNVRGSSPITRVTMTLNGQELAPEIAGPSAFQLSAFTGLTLQPGLYQVLATAEDRSGQTFRTMWQFVVSNNPNDSWWFLADGTPRRAEVEATLRSLVEAFRWHLYGETWDGVYHGEMPTHAQVSAGSIRFDALTPTRYATLSPGPVRIAAHVTSGAPITSFQLWLNGQPLDTEVGGPSETDQTAFTERTLAAGSYAVSARVQNARGEALTVTWGFVVSPLAAESHWFTADGRMKVDTVSRSLKALVEAFRWHFYGQSWDGRPHPELPTHATVVTGPQPIDPWFTADGRPIPQNISATLRSLVEAFRWHFWGYSWDGQQHSTDIPTHAE